MIYKARSTTFYKSLLIVALVLATMLPSSANVSAQSAGGTNTLFLPLVQGSGGGTDSDTPQLIESDDDVSYQPVDDNESEEPADELQGLIVGGSQAYQGQFPYMVSTRHNGSHICGGTLIAPKYVLTAHHCYYNSAAGNVTVATGAHAITGNDAYETISVSKFHFYPGTGMTHQPFNGGHDIMILELSRPAQLLSGRVETIGYNTNVSFGHSGTVRAIGWGATCSTCSGAFYLKYVDMPINGVASAWHIDAGTAHLRQTTCFGDSGGPYVKQGQLVGVTSYTYGATANDYCTGGAGITDVAKHATWIAGIIGTGGGFNPAPVPTPIPTPRPTPVPTPRPTPQPWQSPQSSSCTATNYLCLFDASGFQTNLASLYMPGTGTGYWLNLSQMRHANGNWANRISSSVNNTNSDALMYDKDGYMVYKLQPGQKFSYMGNAIDYAYLCPTSGCWPIFP